MKISKINEMPRGRPVEASMNTYLVSCQRGDELNPKGLNAKLQLSFKGMWYSGKSIA